jgi:hypothetical protein
MEYAGGPMTFDREVLGLDMVAKTEVKLKDFRQIWHRDLTWT